MKKLSVIVLLAVLPCIANAARYSNPYKLNKQPVKIETAKTEPLAKRSVRSADAGFYMGLHADVSFLNWKNEYESNGTDEYSDSFKMKNVIGVDANLGYKFNKKWSAELELGYVGKYSESEKFSTDKTDYDLSAVYFNINGLYDIYNGIYAGVGTGVAVVKADIENTVLGKESKTSLSPMGALMLGYKYDINEHFGVDLRYRFSVFNGPKFGFDSVDVDIETGLITNHTVSVGMKYKF